MHSYNGLTAYLIGVTMKGISASVQNGVLILHITLAQNNGLSKSGRSRLIATTEGNVRLDEISGLKKHRKIYLGLNLFDYAGGIVRKRNRKSKSTASAEIVDAPF